MAVIYAREVLLEAQRMGKMHFKDGGTCVPLLHDELMTLVKKGGEVGCNIPLFKAFIRGFALAELSHGRKQLRS